MPKFLEDQMYKAIRKAFADLRSEEEVTAFLEDLLSPTERIMIAKRLAIAILLDRGYEQRTVGSIMKTSLTTVNQVNYWLKNKGKGYRIVLEKLKTQKQWAEVKEGLEEFLTAFFTVHGQLNHLKGKISKEIQARDNLL